MYLSKYKGKTFPEGKTAEELGIDTSKKFVVVNGSYKGNVVTMVEDDNTTSPLFENSMGHYSSFYLSDIAYLEEEDENEKRWIDGQFKGGNGWAISGLDKTYEPQVGDKISISAVVASVDSDGMMVTLAEGTKTEEDVFLYERDYPSLNLTLISRASRTLTKAEAEKMLSEHLNESITILWTP